MKSQQQDQTKECHQVALDSQNRKDQRVFHDFENGEIEGDQKLIDIEPHGNIDQSQSKDREVHKVRAKRTRSIEEEQEVNNQYRAANEIDQPHKKCLLQVSFDRIKIIGKDENGIPAEQSSQYVGGTHVLPSPCNRKKNKHRNHQNGHPRTENRNFHLNSGQIQCSRQGGGGENFCDSV